MLNLTMIKRKVLYRKIWCYATQNPFLDDFRYRMAYWLLAKMPSLFTFITWTLIVHSELHCYIFCLLEHRKKHVKWNIFAQI